MSATDPYTKESEKRFTLRMDKALFERLELCAKRNRRSVAKEIETAVAIYVDHLENQQPQNNHH